MPRIRSIHPDICVSDTMAELPANLERTFLRLLTHCDDEGRCEDRVKIIKAAIYPLHDAVTVKVLDSELTALHNAGVILRYESAGQGLIQVVSWDEYQHPQKPRPSRYDAPTDAVMESHRTSTRQVVKSYASGEGEGEGDRNTEKEKENGKGIAQLFDSFWKSYPSRSGTKGSKKNALAAFKKLPPDQRELAISSLPRYVQVANGYPKDAERYLRDQMWEGLTAAPNGTPRVPDWKPPPGCPHTEDPTPCAECRRQSHVAAKDLVESIRSRA